MCEESGQSSSTSAVTDSQRAGGDHLTEAQRAFAKMLGRLLAQRWREEQRNKEMTDRSEKRNRKCEE